jgi:aminoglycoside phosphotransferase (APT) family kinase protein
MTVTSTPPGIPSPARLAGWIGDRLGGEPAELADVQLIAGGRSNLTYRLTLSGPGAGPRGERVLVLRRPPLGHVLPTAHDMSREFRVLSGLAGLGRGAGYLTRQLARSRTSG